MNMVYVNKNGGLAKLVSLEDIAMIDENIHCHDGYGVTITYKQGTKIELQTKEAHEFWRAYKEVVDTKIKSHEYKVDSVEANKEREKLLGLKKEKSNMSLYWFKGEIEQGTIAGEDGYGMVVAREIPWSVISKICEAHNQVVQKLLERIP